MTARSSLRSARTARGMATWMLCAVAWQVAWQPFGLGATAAEHDRDWSQVELAWRGDPRPTADLPAGATTPTAEPRLSRRAIRRATRRGWPVTSQDRNHPDAQAPEPTSGLPRPAAEPQDTAAATVPPPVFLGPQAITDAPAIAHRDQPYAAAGHQRQRFDIHIPTGCSGGGLPLVVWIQGEDWQAGSKSDCPLTWLVGRGYAVASVGYRPSDVAVFPAQLDDCRAAVATILADAEIWGVDRDRVCVVGSRAGGHLAALVGFSAAAADASPPLEQQEAAVPDADVAAVCTIAAPVHLTTLGAAHDRGSSAVSRLVGGPLPEIREAALAASPLVHVSADDPPTLVLHGRDDSNIPVDQATRLHKSLQAAGVDSKLVILEAGHPLPLDESSPAGSELLQFLDRVLGPGQRRAPAEPAQEPAVAPATTDGAAPSTSATR